MLRERGVFEGHDEQGQPSLERVEVAQAIPVSVDDREVLVAIVEVRYLDADAEHYIIPLAYAEGDRAHDISTVSPGSVLLSRVGGGIVYDAMADEAFTNAMVDGIGPAARRTVQHLRQPR